jgi:hypothetical protein
MKHKIRKSWGETKPVTKRIENAKAYSRKIKYRRANWMDLE